MGRVTTWLVRAFGGVPADEMGGLPLEGPCWEVAGWHVDHAAFFRHLLVLVPDGAVLALEGGAHPPRLRSFLETHSVPPSAKLQLGTAWPRGLVFHLPATSPLLLELSRMAEACAWPEVCDHLHVYDQQQLLLQWFDAFADPFYVSKQVPEERLRAFCSALHTPFKDAADAP